MYELPAEIRAKIHNYLMSRPMLEVENLVSLLRNLDPIPVKEIEVDATK